MFWPFGNAASPDRNNGTIVPRRYHSEVLYSYSSTKKARVVWFGSEALYSLFRCDWEVYDDSLAKSVHILGIEVTNFVDDVKVHQAYHGW